MVRSDRKSIEGDLFKKFPRSRQIKTATLNHTSIGEEANERLTGKIYRLISHFVSLTVRMFYDYFIYLYTWSVHFGELYEVVYNKIYVNRFNINVSLQFNHPSNKVLIKFIFWIRNYIIKCFRKFSLGL